jgi:hypothetical protein
MTPPILTPALEERILRYIENVPPGIEGQKGSNPTYGVARALTIGFALEREEALRYLRVYSAKCQPPWSEEELEHKVDNALKKSHKKARGYLLGNGSQSAQLYQGSLKAEDYARTRSRATARLSPEVFAKNIERFLGGFRCDEADFWDISPIRPTGNWREDARVLFSHLFGPDEFVVINTAYALKKNADGIEKVQIVGAGAVHRVRDWLRYFAGCGVPQSDAGAWMRINPVRAPKGSGKGGAHEDSDVTAWRFVLVEMDKVPAELQLALLGRLPLPIAAICTSGGKSAQAWLRLDAPGEQQFRVLP